MTVGLQTTYVQYQGNGTTTVFAFPNKIFEASDLAVSLINNATGAATPVSSTAYSVANVDVDTGANVTLTTPPASGYTLDIRSDTPELQTTSIANQGAYYPETIEEALDQLTREVQDLSRTTYTFGIHGPDNEGTPWPALPGPAARAGLALSFDSNGLPTLAALLPTALTQSVFNTFLATGLWYPQTTAEVTAAITPTNYLYREGDIRRYGALVTASNNQPAINQALSVSAAGGSAAYVPAGTWAYTSSLQAIGGSSMYGEGLTSVLAPNGCDGLTFVTPVLYSGSRYFGRFVITGTNTGSNNGIIANYTAASGVKVIGILFENITIQNFGQGVFARGFWTCMFLNVWLYNNYQGYYFHGQNIGVSIVGGNCERGTITGTGTTYGVLVDSVSGESTQALNLTSLTIYGYQVGSNMGPMFNCVISRVTYYVTQYGAQFGAVSGGCTMRDCYIETNNAAFATIGIDLYDLAASSPDAVVIDGNNLVCLSANSGSVGIYVGTNEQSVSVTGNTVGSASGVFATGVSASNNTGLRVQRNTINASATAIQITNYTANAAIRDNTVQNGTPLVFSVGKPSGLRYEAPGMSGTAAFSAGTTVAVTFATAMPDATYRVALEGDAAGNVWASAKSTTGFTANCAVSNSNSVGWEVRYS